MWVGVRFLTTRVSPNDTYGTKMVMRGDGTGKKKRRNEREEGGKKGRGEPRHRNEESIAVLLFAVTFRQGIWIYINRSSD